MNQETLSENFELLTNAPNGMKKFRELILQMAVQGKLLPHNLNDEPASELAKLIAKEKENAIHTKIIRRPQSLPSLVEEELPFDAPSGWTFERFGNLFNFIDYRGKTPEKVESGIRLITAKNIRMGYRQDQPMEFVTEETYNEWMTRGIPEMGDLLFTTEAPMGNVCLVDLDEKFALAQRTINLHPFGEMNSQYLIFAIMSPLIQGMISEKATGMTATGIKAAKLKLIPIPLPPLNEQKRIVAKVDQFMALCGELEAHQQKKHEQCIRLNNAALDKLLTAPTPEEFAQHWQRICDNFDLLYDVPETVGQLRQAILQLGVQGKLVAQDMGDEPAAVLLEKIEIEKEKLLKNKQIKKALFYPLDNEKIPYKLPKDWIWTNLANVGIINPRNTSEDEKEVSFIPMTLISEYYNKPIKSEKRQWGEIKKGFTHFAERDVVMAKITPCFQNGKSAVMHNLNNGLGAGTTELYVFRPLLNNSINPEYILLYLKSPQFLKEGIEKMTGTAGHKRVPKEYFAGNYFPLPPYNEQKRIVAKVDQLVALCDELEAGVVQAQTEGGRLMEAVVHHVLAE